MRRYLDALPFVLMLSACHAGPSRLAHAVPRTATSSTPPAADAELTADPGDLLPVVHAVQEGPVVGPQAPNRISDFDRLALLRWQQALIKRCDAHEALGQTLPSAHADIDLALLRARMQQDGNNAMPLLVTAQERVVFGTPRLAPDAPASEGSAGGARVVASLAQGECTLSIDGMVIYRGMLASQVPVEARIPFAKKAALSQRPTISRAVGRGYVSVQAHGLGDAMQSVITPDAATVTRVAQGLHLPAAQARRIFVRQPELTLTAAMQVLHGDNIPWFSRATPDILGTPEDVASLFTRGDVRTRLRWVWRAQAWPTAQQAAHPQPLWLTVEATVHIRPPRGSAFDTQISVERFAQTGPTFIDGYTGARCLQDRAAMLLGMRGDVHTLSPSFASIAEPCAVFDDEAHPQGYTDGVYMDLLPQVMGHAAPSPNVDWAGWDAVLLRVADDLQRNQQDIVQTMDPHGQAPAIDAVGDAFTTLREASAAHPALASEHTLLANHLGAQALRGRFMPQARLSALLSKMHQVCVAASDAERHRCAQQMIARAPYDHLRAAPPMHNL